MAQSQMLNEIIKTFLFVIALAIVMRFTVRIEWKGKKIMGFNMDIDIDEVDLPRISEFAVGDVIVPEDDDEKHLIVGRIRDQVCTVNLDQSDADEVVAYNFDETDKCRKVGRLAGFSETFDGIGDLEFGDTFITDEGDGRSYMLVGDAYGQYAAIENVGDQLVPRNFSPSTKVKKIGRISDFKIKK